MAELGHVNGEVDAALRAAETGEAVRHVENGLAARAGELDLGGVHTLRPGSGAAAGRSVRRGRVRRCLMLQRRQRRRRRRRRRRSRS